MHSKSICIFFLSLLLSVSKLSTAAEDLPVTYLGIEQGLSNNAVTSIIQDRNGFMWFGTFDGLNRYDGYSFKTFRNNLYDTTSLNANHIRAIGEDASHLLWIGTEKGISIYDPITSSFHGVKFKAISSSSYQLQESVIRIIQRDDKTGLMLVGSLHSGLLMFEKNSRVGVQILLALASKKKESDYDVTAIALDSPRDLAWVFVRQVGLCQYNLKSKSLQVVNTSIKKVDCLKLDSKGDLWLGNEDGLFKYDIGRNVFSSNVMRPTYRVINLFEDKKAVIWICTDGGGVWSMPVGQTVPAAYVSSTGSSLVNSNAIYAIYDDFQGSKWIGTLRGGITVIQPKAKLFKHITCSTSGTSNIVNDFILSFAEDDRKNVWIGTDGAGLRYWDRQNNKFTPYKHDPANRATISSDFITSLLYDSKGDLWTASYFGGVNRLKKGTHKFEQFDCYNSYTNSIENNPWLIYEDSHSRLWVSTTNGGCLYLFNRKSGRFEVFDRTLINIQSISEDSQGNIWIGGHSLLIRLDTANKKHISFNIGQTPRSIFEDKNRNFWIATDGGGLLLFNRANGTYQRFMMNNGLPSNSILRILGDNNNNLWLSTYNGLCKFNTIDKTCRNFSPSDGLQSNQFSFNAAMKLCSGEFLFGGIKGFNIFYPDSIYEEKHTPPIFLTGLRINNTPVEEDDSYVRERNAEWVKQITIPYDQAVLSVDYVALNYNGADKIKYAYKLDGWDKVWTYVNSIRTANYTRLQEGTFRFQVKSTNSAGDWSNETTLFTVIVLPPWYRTWWAYSLFALLAVSGIYLYILYARRQERLKYEVKLANVEKDKEKELTEKKISFFTNIAHEFRSPLTLIINPVKDLLQKTDTSDVQKELNIVHRNARRLLSLVDQLLIFRKADAEVDNMKFSRHNFFDLCEEVFLCFVQQAKLNHQQYVFECENKELMLYVDREKIEIALFNLLSNAIKYTPAGGKIVFCVEESDAEVTISVIDNGYGISKNASSRLFEKFYQAGSDKRPAKAGFGIGLYLVKHFVEGHKGKVTFQSQEGIGTTFAVTLLKGEQHLAGHIIMSDSQKETALLEELNEEPLEENAPGATDNGLEELVSERQTVLVADDDIAIRQYLQQILKDKYDILEAADGAEALDLARTNFPDLVISDIRMEGMDGIELCRQLKCDPALNHIPVILLTGGYRAEVELQSIEGGADDYITKPFDKDILLARVKNLFKGRSELQNYFFNEVTLKKNTLKISPEYKDFLNKCIAIVELHLYNDQFTIKTLAQEIGMSHSYLYKKVRIMSGQSVNSFIRYIRLRKAAELMIKTNCNVNQAAYQVGLSDVKYFRAQFNKLFGMNPSEYIKKYRDPFNKAYQISTNVLKDKPKN